MKNDNKEDYGFLDKFFIYLKEIVLDLSYTQKLLLLLSLFNIVIYELYGTLSIGKHNSYLGRSGRDVYTDEEFFLWIGITLVLIIGVIIFKSKKDK
tara:strand:- start:1122 stop:1409 length:288 start_codon:yes stop_codon:yes gene_type:complete